MTDVPLRRHAVAMRNRAQQLADALNLELDDEADRYTALDVLDALAEAGLALAEVSRQFAGSVCVQARALEAMGL